MTHTECPWLALFCIEWADICKDRAAIDLGGPSVALNAETCRRQQEQLSAIMATHLPPARRMLTPFFSVEYLSASSRVPARIFQPAQATVETRQKSLFVGTFVLGLRPTPQPMRRRIWK